jgi:hypothetical protein
LLALIVGRVRGNVNPQAGIGVRIRVPEVLDLRHHFSAVGAGLLRLDFSTDAISLNEPISGLHVSSPISMRTKLGRAITRSNLSLAILLVGIGIVPGMKPEHEYQPLSGH